MRLPNGMAVAVAHEGGGGHEGVAGPAHVEEGPAVRSEVRTNQPVIGNEARTNQPALGNEARNAGHGEHPFYGNDRAGENDWRYGFNDGRWWYWTPLGAWAYWNDGRWQDYSSSAVPYSTNYRGPTAPTGWYWNDSQKRYYWFDGTNLTAAQQ